MYNKSRGNTANSSTTVLLRRPVTEYPMKVLYMYEQMAQSHNVSEIIATMNNLAVRTGRNM